MNYYRPTTIAQKVKKVLQLYTHFLRTDLSSHTNVQATTNSILMVVPQLDRLGGYERQALELSTSLTNSGVLVSVLSHGGNHFPSREFRNGFMIHRLNGSLPVLFFRLFRFLVRHRSRFQILHAHGVTGFSLVAARIAKFLNKPVCLKPATRDDLRNIVACKSLKCFFYKRWFGKIDRWIAISQELKEEMRSCDIPENRILFIPNAVNHQKFIAPTASRKTQLREHFGVVQKEIIFLFVGRLESRKGVDVLLRAWQKLNGGVLWIVGSGEHERALHSLANELRLKNIQFFRSTLNPLDYYQAADVFVLPSLKEGFPNVLLEAMSCALPSIATNIGGVTDIFKKDQQGLLVPASDPDRLADAMATMLSSATDRYRWGQCAAKTIEDRYNFDRTVMDYLNLYGAFVR